ncbi:unnamed protein product [Mytilus coruscus]|uniref:Uncharacterized protein n=1 Tax=Mytilus coruscus TaxID=42192 RepID=A0A6J8BMF6_MYTCO|nr:unnamed protein product [Mytilus coruscus]
MCAILLRLLKYQSIKLKNDGLLKEKPLHWPTDWSFYNPRNKRKGQGYNAQSEKKLLECLEEQCNVEHIFKETRKFDDEQAKFKVKQYQKEIIAWKNNKSELFELYISRQEIDILSPCNAGKRKEEGQSQKLVDNILTNRKINNIAIPSELHPLVKAWKQKNTSAISKSYTIWSKITLEISRARRFVRKDTFLQSLKQIGVILNTVFWGCPSLYKDYASDNDDDKIQNFGFSYHSHNSPFSDAQVATLSNSKGVSSVQINIYDQSMQLWTLTQPTLSNTHISSYCLESHTHTVNFAVLNLI